MRQLFALLLLLIACGAPPRPREDIRESARGYLRALRWGLEAEALQHVAGAFREEWRGRQERERRFTELEILQIKAIDDEHAQLRISIAWYHPRSLSVQRRYMIQLWERKGNVWFLNKETDEEESAGYGGTGLY